MSLFRRERDPDKQRIVTAFRAAAMQIDAAQRALLSAIPTARDPGRPLPEALDDFERLLHAAERAMPGWRVARTDESWRQCAAAIAEARVEAAKLRAHGSGLGFEALNIRVGEVIAPLEIFVDVASALRRL